MVIVPFPDGLEIPAHVVDLKIGPLSFDSLVSKLRELLEGEDADVAVAHKILPDGLNTVVCRVLVRAAPGPFVVTSLTNMTKQILRAINVPNISAK